MLKNFCKTSDKPQYETLQRKVGRKDIKHVCMIYLPTTLNCWFVDLTKLRLSYGIFCDGAKVVWSLRACVDEFNVLCWNHWTMLWPILCFMCHILKYSNVVILANITITFLAWITTNLHIILTCHHIFNSPFWYVHRCLNWKQQIWERKRGLLIPEKKSKVFWELQRTQCSKLIPI